jgi:hypothetical protein
MRYPIKLPKSFMDALLTHFSEGEVAVGGGFDGPAHGSLGEFIQQKLHTKMNPAVYVAALLIEEGYADAHGVAIFPHLAPPASAPPASAPPSGASSKYGEI